MKPIATTPRNLTLVRLAASLVAWTAMVHLAAGCRDDRHVIEPVEATPSAPRLAWDCPAAEEFTAAMGYLRHATALKLGEPAMRALALRVAAGCEGAAARFAATFELLSRSHLDSASALEVAVQVGSRDDQTKQAFDLVFRRAFLATELDLELHESLQLARDLALDLSGDTTQASEDFATVVRFCTGRGGLDLPKPGCAKLAARLARRAAQGDGTSVAVAFVDAFEFLTGADGPHVTTADALRIAEEVVAISPFAVENYRRAYGFAVATKGLRLSRQDGLKLALSVAEQTVRPLPPVPRHLEREASR